MLLRDNTSNDKGKRIVGSCNEFMKPRSLNGSLIMKVLPQLHKKLVPSWTHSSQTVKVSCALRLRCQHHRRCKIMHVHAQAVEFPSGD